MSASLRTSTRWSPSAAGHRSTTNAIQRSQSMAGQRHASRPGRDRVGVIPAAWSSCGQRARPVTEPCSASASGIAGMTSTSLLSAESAIQPGGRTSGTNELSALQERCPRIAVSRALTEPGRRPDGQCRAHAAAPVPGSGRRPGDARPDGDRVVAGGFVSSRASEPRCDRRGHLTAAT